MLKLQSDNLRALLYSKPLTYTNFGEWKKNLTLALRYERKLDAIKDPLWVFDEVNATEDDRKEYGDALDKSEFVACLMIGSMSPEIQTKFLEEKDAYILMTKLEQMFEKNEDGQRYDLVKSIFESKLKPGQYATPHLLNMKGWFDRLKDLYIDLGDKLATSIILDSLHDGYNTFKTQFNVVKGDKDLNDLSGQIKQSEANLPKEFAPKDEILAMGAPRKGKGKTKAKGKLQKKQQNKEPVQGKGIAKGGKVKASQADAVCFHCNKKGHWKRNCLQYLKEKKEGKLPSSTSGTK